MAPVKATARVYGGESGDTRAVRRREALVETAFALVAEHGWRRLSIEAVCRRAGLNKRYFYAAFADLDALIAAVTERLADDAIAVTLAAVPSGGSPAQATRAALAVFVAHLTDDPRRARVLFGAVPAADAAAGHRAEAIRRLIATVAAQGRSLYGIASSDPAIELSAAMLIGGTSQALLDWLDGRVTCSRAELVDDLVDLWLAVGDAAVAARRTRPAAPA
jgi:AcrR family transcriptional regulator